jgi:hypothetical protein
MTRWFTPLLTRLACIGDHGVTIRLLMQYVCDPRNILLADNVAAEIEHILSEILHADDVGGISAVIEVFDRVNSHLNVSAIKL